jgi:hypothetical protein
MHSQHHFGNPCRAPSHSGGQLKFADGGSAVDRATFASWEQQDEIGAMKRIVSTIVFSLAIRLA